MSNLEHLTMARARRTLRSQPWNDRFEEFLLPSWRLRPQRTAMTSIAPGASRFGGVPDVPRDFAWPTTRDGEPLRFLAQIALEDVGQVGRGAMLFFCHHQFSGHVSQFGSWRVFEIPPHVSLARRDAPPGVHGDIPCCVSAVAEATLPSPESLAMLSGRATPFASNRDYEAYVAFRASLSTTSAKKRLHRFLGHPDEIQTSPYGGFASALVERRARTGIDPFTKQPHTFPGLSIADVPPDRVSFLRSTTEWRLLLQLDSDEEGPGWLWGDVGRVAFWIAASDLAQWRLDRVWIALDSH